MLQLTSICNLLKNVVTAHSRILTTHMKAEAVNWPTNACCSARFSIARHCSSYSKATGTEPDQLYKTVDIEVKGHDTAVLNSYETFVKMAAKELDINISKIWSPPKVIKRYTLLKSVHVYRKHMVQYESRTQFRCFQLKHLTGSTANTLLEYIQRNLPEGMAMKVTRHAIEALPDHLRSSPVVMETVNRQQ